MVIYYLLLDDINFIQELTIISSHIKLLILRSKRKIYAHKFDPMKDKWNIGLVYTLCKVLILRKHDASQLLRVESFTRTISIRPLEKLVSPYLIPLSKTAKFLSQSVECKLVKNSKINLI